MAQNKFIHQKGINMQAVEVDFLYNKMTTDQIAEKYSVEHHQARIMINLIVKGAPSPDESTPPPAQTPKFTPNIDVRQIKNDLLSLYREGSISTYDLRRYGI